MQKGASESRVGERGAARLLTATVAAVAAQNDIEKERGREGGRARMRESGGRGRERRRVFPNRKILQFKEGQRRIDMYRNQHCGVK